VLGGIGTADDLVLTAGPDGRAHLLDAKPFASGVVVLSYRLGWTCGAGAGDVDQVREPRGRWR
jgi:hypothetical protein